MLLQLASKVSPVHVLDKNCRFKYRPSIKDWAKIAVPKDSSYTPRTLFALGALMDVSKADMDRAKTKSVKVFPAGTPFAADSLAVFLTK